MFLPPAVGGEVSYSSKGNLDTPPYARLEADILTRGQSERMAVARGYPGVYRIAVHAYSREAPLSQSRAEVRFRLGAAEEKFICPTSGTGEWWHVVDVDILQGKVAAHGGLSLKPPLPAEVQQEGSSSDQQERKP